MLIALGVFAYIIAGLCFAIVLDVNQAYSDDDDRLFEIPATIILWPFLIIAVPSGALLLVCMHLVSILSMKTSSFVASRIKGE